ncbi:NAD(P)-binding protein [Hymenopellis radicata]|nr:NAD(P)-binding protein [Hymenopellis radicata]
MSTTTKPFVLLVGGAGQTGRVITKALLKEGKFRVALLVRPSSVNKPVVQELKAAGAEVRIGDITEAPEKLEAFLEGVDILVSLVLAWIDQKPLFRAAKKTGVGRVVPSDFGPYAPRGVTALQDMKLGVRDYIKELGLSYTFIEVGWWLQGMLPWPHATPENFFITKTYVGDRQQKTLYIDINSIGTFVARILADPRTLNQTVMAYDGEANLDEVYPVANRITGEDFFDFTRVWIVVSPSMIPVMLIATYEEIFARMKSNDMATKVVSEYFHSLYIRGDNTLAKAVAGGSLDARKLYPDVPVVTVEQAAKEFYANLPICRV